jgi:hypothetical protein
MIPGKMNAITNTRKMNMVKIVVQTDIYKSLHEENNSRYGENSYLDEVTIRDRKLKAHEVFIKTAYKDVLEIHRSHQKLSKSPLEGF